MKYLVRNYFSGHVQQWIEADSEEQAMSMADVAIGNMDSDTFLAELEPQRMGQDVELDEE